MKKNLEKWIWKSKSCNFWWLLIIQTWTDSCVCGPKRTSQLVQCSQTYFCKAICGEVHLSSSTLLQEIFFNAFGHRSNLFQNAQRFNRDLIYLESNLKLRTHLEDLDIPKAEPLLGFLFQGLTVIFLLIFFFLTPQILGY